MDLLKIEIYELKRPALNSRKSWWHLWRYVPCLTSGCMLSPFHQTAHIHPSAQLWSDRHREPHFSWFVIHANDFSI